MTEPNPLAALYRPSLALATDLYQLTMAYGYWKTGLHRHDATFHLFFRRAPFGGGYAIACGLHHAIELLDGLRFSADDVAYLATLTGNDGRPLFDDGFLAYLRDLRFSCDVDAVPEGTPVFPHEPLVRLCGPLDQCQLVETALLNLVNFQTLIATKAARVVAAAGDAPVLEFGLRRAQGLDGAMAASRAAYVGGCAATSNVLAGKVFGIPVRGTHAHSWVMAFSSEQAAFEAYADALPNNCVFLVDTYDTLRGVARAIDVARALRARGHELVGVRLDSGDLAALAHGARRLLDEAGFPAAAVVASNDLDEHTITALRAREAPIGVYGVGTHLVTGGGQAALGGVYKLAAVRGPGEAAWQDRLKLSEDAIKTSNPGVQQVRRYFAAGEAAGDVIWAEGAPPGPTPAGIALADGAPLTLPADAHGEDLLVPIFRGGRCVYPRPPLAAVRAHTLRELPRLPAAVRRLDAPAPYPVGLEPSLHARKQALIAQPEAPRKE